ncbi:hypothetical protein [Nostoc sp. ChiVER01]|uniref:hypothetical protein n=1 Tax=Nostoc sp. ChiVER01 TaxID=3075382 RepID=UPI002AD2EC89|nr:hypothetical protein [Nostoc sp. ChiVER01]MDZ8222656.1 hypothetical protein [Nostoc sp. ChiVER01]
MFNSFSRRRIVKVAIGFVAGIACIVQTQTIMQAQSTDGVITNGIYTIRSLGTTPGPDYLDGRTGNGMVGLAPTFTGGFTGARWQIVKRGSYYTIRSCGTTPGPDYLDGRTANGTVGLAPTYTGGFTGATWSIIFTGTYFVIRSNGIIIPRYIYLDGRTANGTVGLIIPPSSFERGFTGARWSITRTNESCPGRPG